MKSINKNVGVCKSKKENCIVFGITSNLAFAVANIIIAIEEFSPNLIDKYIILFDSEDPISNDERNVLTKISENIEFEELYLDNKINLSSDLLNRYSKLNFSKFEILRFLEQYKKVLWLDADILIQGDISEIFDYGPLGWRKAVQSFKEYMPVEEWEGKKIINSYSVPNGGVILVTEEIGDYYNIYNECIDIFNKLTELSETIPYDELTFALLNFKYDLGANELPAKFNSGTGWKNSQDAIIVHSIGTMKFWNDALRYILFPQWRRFNKKYIELGGESVVTKLKDEKVLGRNAQSLLRAFMNYDFWNKILENAWFSEDIIQSHCFFKKYFQLFLKDVKRDIHYELIKLDDNVIKVALHIEKDSLLWLHSKTHYLKTLHQLAKFIDFKIEDKDKVFAVSKVVKKKYALKYLHKLIANTSSYLILCFSTKLSRKEKLKYILKYYYRYYKGKLNAY